MHINPDSKPEDFFLKDAWGGGGSELRRRSAVGDFIVAYINDKADADVIFAALQNHLRRP